MCEHRKRCDGDCCTPATEAIFILAARLLEDCESSEYVGLFTVVWRVFIELGEGSITARDLKRALQMDFLEFLKDREATFEKNLLLVQLSKHSEYRAVHFAARLRHLQKHRDLLAQISAPALVFVLPPPAQQ